ncbi:YjbQ family protein, partial [Methanospirillum hungatei]
MKWIKIDVRTGSRTQFVDITDGISEKVRRNGVQNGTCFVFTQHTTAGL